MHLVFSKFGTGNASCRPMKPVVLRISLALIAQCALGQPAKVGTVNLQRAIIECSDGQRAIVRLRREFEPDELRLNNAEAQIKEDRAKLDRDSRHRSWWFPWRHAFSTKARAGRLAAIAHRERDLIRERDDLREIFDKERTRVVNEIGGPMKLVIARYSVEQGYSEIGETAGLLAAEDVTDPVVALYNQVYPAKP